MHPNGLLSANCETWDVIDVRTLFHPQPLWTLVHLSVQQFAGCVHLRNASLNSYCRERQVFNAGYDGVFIQQSIRQNYCTVEESLLYVFSVGEWFPTFSFALKNVRAALCNLVLGGPWCFKCATLLNLFWHCPWWLQPFSFEVFRAWCLMFDTCVVWSALCQMVTGYGTCAVKAAQGPLSKNCVLLFFCVR